MEQRVIRYNTVKSIITMAKCSPHLIKTMTTTVSILSTFSVRHSPYFLISGRQLRVLLQIGLVVRLMLRHQFEWKVLRGQLQWKRHPRRDLLGTVEGIER